MRVFPRNFEFLPNFHKCFYNSIATRKKCFLFPLLNSLLKTLKRLNLLILITKYCLYFIFLNSRAIHATRAKIPVFLSCYRNTGFLSFRPINARVLKRLFYKCKQYASAHRYCDLLGYLCFLPTNYLTLQIFMKTICSFHFELSQKLKQLNIIFLMIPLVKREAESIILQSAKCFAKIQNWTNTNGQNKLAIYFIMFHI